MKPKVTLISWTKDPVETIFCLWQASRNNEPCWTTGKVKEACKHDKKFEAEVYAIFKKAINAKIPIAENLDFVFLLEDVTIAFREQMVRHRVGVKSGERIGVDIVPDCTDSSWWSQSMRTLDMQNFYDQGYYAAPEGMDQNQESIFHHALRTIQEAYRALERSGLGLEAARELIPLCATHRISWKLNLSAFQNVVGKRGCWIAQSDLWQPVIQGMLKELTEKVDPYFKNMATPPCTTGGKHKGCWFSIDNERRNSGTDILPTCPIWSGARKIAPKDTPMFQKMLARYVSLWGRNWTEYL